MFYGLNLRISETKDNTALRQQGDSNFSIGTGGNLFLSQENKFEIDGLGCGKNQSQTFSIILPNLIHQSKKRNL